jgi:peptidoglycan/LPS O-acetylase OafA/YrhL
MLEIARRVTLPGSQALHLVVFVVIAIFFGCCVHYFVERPLIAWTRKLMETRTKLPEKKPA